MAFYAAINTRANATQIIHGFDNTWQIARFAKKSERDLFVRDHEALDAKPVTRAEAEELFADKYRLAREPVPKGGLFGLSAYGSRFWNEQDDDDTL